MSVKSLLKKIVDLVAPSLLYHRFIKNMTAKEPEIVLLPLLCSKDMLAVDVGANRGLYVHHLLSITKNVVAFEPLPPMQEVLRRVYGNRIRLESIALSDAPGVAELRFPEGNYSWATLERSNDLSLCKSKKIIVKKTELRTLDSYDFYNIGIIKIDVEGHEEAVVSGSCETLRRTKPSLIIEIEERHNKGSLNRIYETLKTLQYVGFFIADGALHCIDEFYSDRDQPIENVGLSGKTGRYINNFIFIPRARSGEFQSAATKLLAGYTKIL